ncbi:MAG: sugar O-acetyltransferase [Christensenellales bacterium]
MTEEEKLLSGKMYCPGDPSLKALKRKSHALSARYNTLFEDETELRGKILRELFAEFGEGSFIQGPMQIHYGCHTKIGKRFFGNFNLTIQDDANVTIGDGCDFGPNVTIVTPIHPMIASERKYLLNDAGEKVRLCYAKPVVIGDECWLGANVVVCPGVTIGDECVIGAGSVVTKDIPPRSFAAGCPARVIREIAEQDSMKYKPDISQGYRPEE